MDREAQDRFKNEFDHSEEIQLLRKEVYLHFTTKLIELIAPYLAIIEDADDDEMVDPTNVGFERNFGILKFVEDRF